MILIKKGSWAGFVSAWLDSREDYGLIIMN